MKNLVKKAEKRDFWSLAKRVMIVAIMVIGFIMPAQVSAQNANRGKEKERSAMVHKKNDKKENKKNKKAAHKDNKAHKPNVVVVEHHHNSKPVVVHHHDNDGAEVVAAAIGLAALIALIAN